MKGKFKMDFLRSGGSLCGTLGMLLIIAQVSVSMDDNVCDRRPLGTKTEPLPPDNRFKIDIIGLNDMYIPQHQYTVRLYSSDDSSTFIAFTISARGDTKPNEKNPRKPTLLDPGHILASPDSDTVPSPICNNSVIQLDITPKTSVKAIWKAPQKDNKCVTIYAVLAVKRDVWYSYEGPLSKRVCEDLRKAEDMQPTENDNCNVCEDARYMITFEGLWSYNTHPLMFPTKDPGSARFSDVVGASHSKNYNVYRFNSDASQGLKMLAAQGNTTGLEIEIREQLSSSVRTIIKATSQPKPNMVTSSTFRSSREHHLVSLVTAIIPSPDWFLGVANMELCDINTGTWTPNLTLNLYPLDAGTDSGLTFESPNEETMPPQPISSAIINKSIPKEQIKPFARLRFDLIRTYSTSACTSEVEATESTDDRNEQAREFSPSTSQTTERQPILDPESSAECPMTEWEDWMPCEGICEDNVLKGYHTRIRYHLVDNVPVRKYVENGPSYEYKEASPFCLENYPESETEECEEPCNEEEEVTAQRRIWRDPVPPGRGWSRK